MTPGKSRVRVPYKVCDRFDETSTEVMTWIEVDVQHVSMTDAPVAMKLTSEQRSIDYRLHDGRLWTEATSLRAPIQPYHPFFRDGRIRLDHPLLIGLRLVDNITRGSSFVEVPHPATDTGDAVADRIRDNTPDFLMIGESLWRASAGPLLTYHDYNRSWTWASGVPLHDYSPHAFRLRTFPIHQLEQAAEFSRRFTGRDPDTAPGRTPELLIDHVQSYDVLANAQEALAWRTAWAVRRHPVNELGPEAVFLLTRLRDALDRRWPGHGVDFHGTNSQGDMWPHRPGRIDFPDGTEIADLSMDLLDASRHCISKDRHAEAASYGHLRDVMRDAARPARQDVAADDADLDALAGPMF